MGGLSTALRNCLVAQVLVEARMLTPKSLQARLFSLQQSNIALWWREILLQGSLVRLVQAAHLKLHRSFASCKAIGMVNSSLRTSTRTTAEAPKMSIRSWVLSTHLTRLLHAMTAPSSLAPSGLWLITKSQRTLSGLSLPSILVLLRVRPSQLAGIQRISTKGEILGTPLRTRNGA